MSSLVLSSVVAVFVVFTVIGQIDTARSNCAIGSACDKCGSKVKVITKYNIKVCCKTCSRRFVAGNLPGGRGYCTCYDVPRPKPRPEDISGNCWKGSQCNQCDKGYVGSINGLKLCCANCEKSGLALSSKSCKCLHNGK